MSNDLVSVVTPVGELHWVNITGEGKLNYNEDGRNYVATIHLTGEKAEALKAKCDEVLGEVPKGKTVKSYGYRELVKDSEGNLYQPDKNGNVSKAGEDITSECEPSGVYAFTWSTSTTFPDGKKQVINVYDTVPKKVNMGGKLIGNGSKGAISGKLRRFEKGKEVGVSLFLGSIQLVKFEEYSGDAGFEAQEGDFEGLEDAETGFKAQDAEETTQKEKPKL